MATPTSDTFPRTMQKGAFAGRHFETKNEYQKAIRDLNKVRGKRGGRVPVVGGDESKFTLKLISGTLEVTITGDPRRPEDIDKMLDSLAAFGTSA